MSNDSRAASSDLGRSLDSLGQLRHSAVASIVLMLIGVAVIAAAFVYSVTRLKPLEDQIALKQTEIQQQTAELMKLQENINGAQKELAEITEKLETAKKGLSEAEVALKSIAAGDPNPRIQAQRALLRVFDASKSVHLIPPTVNPDVLKTKPPLLVPTTPGVQFDLVVMPKVLGAKEDQAVGTLKEKGEFGVIIVRGSNGNCEENSVYAQDPAPGTPVSRGKSVTIKVCARKEDK